MLLDDLVGVIELLKERIATHGASLRENEIRTRTALIDPLLTALGWDVSDPSLVTPEYKVGSAGNSPRADYGLLDNNRNLVSAIESKRLGESLANHEKQIFDYAWNLQIKFAGLTDGDHWYFVDLSQIASADKTILQLRLTDTPAHEAALKLLLLWRPNLASARPVAANAPVLAVPNTVEVHAVNGTDLVPAPASRPVQLASARPAAGNAIPLNLVQYTLGDSPPVEIRFPSGEAKEIRKWVNIWFEVCQWLDAGGRLTEESYSLPGSKKMSLINKSGIHPTGRKFSVSRKTSTGLFVECNYNPGNVIRNALFILQEIGIPPEAVELRFE